MPHLIDIFLHLDVYLGAFIHAYGAWVYALLTLIIFCETGLVVAVFLPGDSLLFAAGAFAAGGGLRLWAVLASLIFAAVAGNTVNYWIGRSLGRGIVEKGRFLSVPIRKEHIERTHAFYEKHGAMAVLLSRFFPIIRTIAPFFGGMVGMGYRKFLSYNAAGGILWVSLFALGGYFFGNIPFLKKNFEFAMLGIVVISLLPAFVELVRSRSRRPVSAA